MSDTRPVDQTDRRILDVLRHDGRISISELAAQVHISRANAYQRVERLQADHVITGFTATIDPTKIGLGITALILLDVEQHGWRTVREHLRALPSLHYMALTSGAFDIVLLVRVDTVETLRDVVLDHLQGMAQIRSTQTVFVLDEDRDLPTRERR